MNDDKLSGLTRSCIDILGKEWNYECMGCSISNKEIIPPGDIVYEGKHCILASDPEIPIPGFLIINSKRHVKSFSEFEKDERHEIVDVLYNAEKALKKLNICNEFTIVQEERSRHLHVWIFPNYDWMNKKFGKGITYLREISAYAQDNSDDDNIRKVLKVVEDVRNIFNELYHNQ